MCVSRRTYRMFRIPKNQILAQGITDQTIKLTLFSIFLKTKWNEAVEALFGRKLKLI